jgi:Nucleotidyl transferase AbiEii toxin, Type IV TA system
VRSAFDRRVLPDPVLALVRACQQRAPAHLAGGAALSGAHLSHRLSGDVDLFCHRAEDVRVLVRELPDVRDFHAWLLRE